LQTLSSPFLCNVPLAPRTTLRVGGNARWLQEITDPQELITLTKDLHHRALPYTILAGGSNVVISDKGIDGHVLAINLRGLRFTEETDDTVLVEAAAGEPWDPFVARCGEEGLAGLEALSGIPGQVGATPVQNVGAYGQSVADSIVSVQVYKPAEDRREILDNLACEFSYRDSIFKHGLAGAAVILSVTFRLRKGPPATARYGELTKALAERYGASPSLQEFRTTVLELRRRKGMLADASRPEGRSVGSFFTNPVLPQKQWQQIRATAQEKGLLTSEEPVPVHDGGSGQVKVAAACRHFAPPRPMPYQ
jgi:UDP-N-acetylmuramate dehydrogenase